MLEEGKHRVLVIDDSRSDGILIQDALVNVHCDWEMASSIEEADIRVERFDPHLIILDVGIPHTFGSPNIPFEQLLQLIQKYRKKHAVVLLTGFVNMDHVRQAMAAGAVDYLDKSIVGNRLLFEARVRQAIQLHDARIRNDALHPVLEIAHATRASVETCFTVLRKTIDQVRIQAGGSQDQKMEQAKTESFQRGRDFESDRQKTKWRKWRNRVWAAFIGALGWFLGIVLDRLARKGD